MKKIVLLVAFALVLTGCVAPSVNNTDSNSRESSNTEPPASMSASTEAVMITEEEALQIALDHAGLNQGAVKSLTVECDFGDGEDEIDFFTKGMEYEYEIDAYTGKILKAEKGRD